jgi:hypothetical protein
VALQLSVDACGRTFVVKDGEVNARAVSLFGRLSCSSRSPVSPPLPDFDSDSHAETRSLSLFFRRLWNSSLERKPLFAVLRGCVRSLPDSVSLLSADAVDSIFSDATFCIDSEISLLRHVRWNCLTESLPPAFEKAACAKQCSEGGNLGFAAKGA